MMMNMTTGVETDGERDGGRLHYQHSADSFFVKGHVTLWMTPVSIF
jgi:hypothetical protein